MDRVQELVNQYSAYGVDYYIIKAVYENTSNADRDRLFYDADYFFEQVQLQRSRLDNAVNKNALPLANPAGDYGISNEDYQLNQAIEASMKKNDNASYEPLTLEQKLRKSGEPVGLKNVGNTCYFNSLLQTLFRVRPFVKEVLHFVPRGKSEINNVEPHILKRMSESRELVKNLQRLFARLIGSDQKYSDPSDVLNRTVDDLGNPVRIGDQEDIVEFSVNFLERINEVFSASDPNNV